ncbi:hypothetical protein [Stenotrophomonas sp. 24(2023)]|nr:hypothetical protein [Stenotrophomonas sp. 24(2023)]WMJ71558.1 hypothetical protein Q9R17_05160 [Stenotrophomonas sp. 24(2023)]
MKLLRPGAIYTFTDAAAQRPPQEEEGLLHAVVVLADHAGALVAPAAWVG